MKKKIFKLNIIFLIIFSSTGLFSEQTYNAIDYYNLGKEAELSGEFYRAVEMYKSALLLNENYLNAITGLAHAYYGLDEYEESLKYIKFAENYDNKNTDILILKARIFLGLGKLEESKKIFENVLNIEENNIEAKFGLAEIDIASGRLLAAEDRYEEVLLFSPESRKALLSLVLINDSKDNFSVADIYIQQALKSYPENPFVRYIAAKHYYSISNVDESVYHLNTALMIKPDFLEASVFLAEIFIYQGNYKKAADEIEKTIEKNESEYILWYMLGRAYENLNQPEKAVQYYARSILNKPDEEIARLALENELSNEFRMDSYERERYSDYHLNMGNKYEEINLPKKALKEYRRAIKINPYSHEARYSYAKIIKKKGYFERYIQILQQLQDEGNESIEIKDEIEIQKSMLKKTLSEKWAVDQFLVNREVNKVSIFVQNCSMNHIEGDEVLNEYLAYLLMGFENIEIKSNMVLEDFSDCYKKARENNSEYFILISCIEDERIVSLEANIYNASTGSLIKTISSVKTGNQMFVNACRELTDKIQILLPVYGRILNRRFDNVIVNLGKKDGIKIGDELNILKKDSIKFSKDDFSLLFEDDEILGTYTVSDVNELISEGTVEPESFFDMINQGDLVFLKPEINKKEEAPEPESEQMSIFTDLFNSINNIQ